jgi:caa(3)-type oxidase subunit IV
MTNEPDQTEDTAAAPRRPSGRMLVITGIGLIALACTSWALSAVGAPPIVALLIAAIKAIWIATVFMELAHAHAVPRTIAVIAVLFVALLCAGTLADVDLR